jgi:hypothetical protein
MTFGRLQPMAYTSTDAATLFVDDEQLIKSYQAKHITLDELSLTSKESCRQFRHWAHVYERQAGV